MDSIDYYNKYANSYFEGTVELDMGETLERFMAMLPEGAEVLDLGCGSGRDSLKLIERGFDVTAVDGSIELCGLASIHIGQDVLHMQFQELDFQQVFDGIWACASLLHTSAEELKVVLEKVIDGLKPGGILYMSFKHGEFTGFRNGRYFTDYKTKAMKEVLSKFQNIELVDLWKTSDIRNDKLSNEWLNVLVRKSRKEQG